MKNTWNAKRCSKIITSGASSASAVIVAFAACCYHVTPSAYFVYETVTLTYCFLFHPNFFCSLLSVSEIYTLSTAYSLI